MTKLEDNITDVIDKDYYDELVDVVAETQGKKREEVVEQIDTGVRLTLEAAETLGDNIVVREEPNLLYIYERYGVKDEGKKYDEEIISIHYTPYAIQSNVKDLREESNK